MLRFAFVLGWLIVGVAGALPALAQQPTPADTLLIRQQYRKLDRRIPMRDGTLLYTTLYVPRDASRQNRYPFLLTRTPYSAGPYGENKYRKRGPGPSKELSAEQYIYRRQNKKLKAAKQKVHYSSPSQMLLNSIYASSKAVDTTCIISTLRLGCFT